MGKRRVASTSTGPEAAERGDATASAGAGDPTAPAPRRARATAESMAGRQRDISVSEFFAKNRHLLGFDNPRKALLTTVKEAVDNSLDACEEAGILPEIVVVIEDLNPDRPATAKSSRYRVTVVDNGPGIVRSQVEHVFGRLLYGSKFHRLKMSRGQQGIGISAAGMYGLITTGRPMLIQTRPRAGRPAHHIELAMNTKTNRAEVTVDEETDDFPLRRLRELGPAVRDLSASGEFLSPAAFPTGTSVSIELEGKHQRGRGSVDEFLELTAIANPHARFVYVRPTRESAEEADPQLPLSRRSAGRAPGPADAGTQQPGSPAEPIGGLAAGAADSSPDPATATRDLGPIAIYPRAVTDLPPETAEIQPHPRGVELGTLLQMLKDFEASKEGARGSLHQFLQSRFCRVSAATAAEFCKRAGATSRTRVADLEPAAAEALYKAFQEVRLPPPPTDCLAPIGVHQLLRGMFKGVRAEFYAASSREPEVYRGRPFQVEAALAFGGELPADEPARVIRFANRVPLLYQQAACSTYRAVAETNWRNYDLQQPRSSPPVAPLVIMIHVASVWVPFTSESKEAIADYDEIRREMKLALMECGRKLGSFLRKRGLVRREGERRDVFERYIGEVARAVSAITGDDAARVHAALLDRARQKTAFAEVVLDDQGRAVRDAGRGKETDKDADDDRGVIVVGRGPRPPGPSGPDLDPGPDPGRVPEVSTGPGPGSVQGNRVPTRRGPSRGKPSRGSPRGRSNEPNGIGEPEASEGRASGAAPARAVSAVEPRPSPATAPEVGPVPRRDADSHGTARSAQEKTPKPRMRLERGRLIPAGPDQPGLF